MNRFPTLHPRSATEIAEPPVAKFLFADTRMAWLWLVVRLYIAYEWITAGWEKMTGHSIALGSFGQSTGESWVFGAHAGTAMKGFVASSLALTTGAHPSVQGWYATFLQHFVLPNALAFSYVITFGEILVGLGLIFGALTGIAAFFGLFMNLNYLFAGMVSINPIMGALTMLLVLAWRIAGYYGIDRYLLPILGTPWTGSLEKKIRQENAAQILAAD
jgi:thiosulfate dehydrogenase [quinone] large subunit